MRRTSRFVSALVSTALIGSGLVVVGAPPASADPVSDDVAALLANLGDFAVLSKDLAPVGALGQPLPLVDLVPSGANALGFADVFKKGVVDQLNGATTFDTLAVDNSASPLTLADGRKAVLKTQVADTNGVETLTLDLTVTRTVDTTAAITSDSPRVDLRIPAKTALTLHSHQVWTYDTTTTPNTVSLARAASTPLLDVDSTTTLAPSGEASIGIMGVDVDTAQSSFTVTTGLSTTVDDPNSDGRLAFAEVAGDGELAAPGAAAGLFHPALRTPAGSASGTIKVTSQPLAGFGSGGLAATVTVATTAPWDGLAKPVVTAVGLDPLARFQLLSARDLSDGIRRLGDTVTALQRARFKGGDGGALGDIDLPFLKGSVADALPVAETLAAFVTQNTHPATDGAALAGKPTFTSVQKFLEKLDATTGPGGSTIDVSDTVWNGTTNRLSFRLDLTRDAPTSADPALNQPVVLASNAGSSVTYGAKDLVDTEQAFAPNSLQGRDVAVQLSSGIAIGKVESNTATRITLVDKWVSGTPAVTVLPDAGDAYVVRSADPKTGQVQLADRLTTNGITGANANGSTATVRPTYAAQLTVVLDLETAKTGIGCNAGTDALWVGTGSAACPYNRLNLDGSTTVIEEQPANVDRFQLRTGAPLLSGGFRITSPIDISARVGYLGVKLGGEVRVCSGSLGDTCSDAGDPRDMSTLTLAANGDLPLDQVFAKLAASPTAVLSGTRSVRGYVDLSATVPDLGAAFPAMSGWLKMADAGAPATPPLPVPATSSLDGLDPIKAFDVDPENSSQLFGNILKTLTLLNTEVSNLQSTGTTQTVLDTTVPVLGQDVRSFFRAVTTTTHAGTLYADNTITDPAATTFGPELVGRAILVGTYAGVVTAVDVAGKQLTVAPSFTQGTGADNVLPATGTPYSFRSELSDAVDKLGAAPPDTLQDLVKALHALLGSDSPVTASFVAASGTDPARLALDVDWNQTSTSTAAVSVDVSSVDAGGPDALVGSADTPTVDVTVKGRTQVRLLLPLVKSSGPDTTKDVTLDPTKSSLKVDVTAAGAPFATAASLGGFALSLGNPSSSAEADKAVVKADFGIALASAATGTAPLDTFLTTGLTATATANQVTCGTGVDQLGMGICARLPLFTQSGSAWTKIGTSDAEVRLPAGPTDTKDLFDLTGADISSSKRLVVPVELAAAVKAAGIDFNTLGDGFTRYISMLEQGLRDAAGGGKIPLVGDDVQKGANFLGDVKTSFDDALSGSDGIASITSIAALKTWASAKLSAALTVDGGPTVTATIDTVCSYKLKPAAISVVPTGGVTGTPYAYAVIARQGTTATVPSATVTVSNQATLDPSHFNTISWSKVTGADNYIVIRELSPGSWRRIADISDGATVTYKDADGTGAVFSDIETSQPTLTNCDPDVSVSSITGVTVAFDLGTDPDSLSEVGGCVDNTSTPASDCLQLAKIPLDIGIPGLSFRPANPDDGQLSVSLGWRLHLKFGLTKDDGFVIYTKDEKTPLPELQVGVGVSMPVDGFNAQVAILTTSIKPLDDKKTTLFGGVFSVDLKTTGEKTCWSAASGKPACDQDETKFLTLSDLAKITDHVAVALTGGVDIHWNWDAKADPSLPGLGGEFNLTWGFGVGSEPVDSSDLEISFDNLYLSLGEFLGGALKPVFKQIKSLTGPLQPIIDTLYAPIPVLSDLSRAVGGDDITLVTLAKTFSIIAGGPDLKFVDTVLGAVKLANAIATSAAEPDATIPLGGFDVPKSEALITKAGVASAKSLIKGKPNLPSGEDMRKNFNKGTTGGAKTLFTSSGLPAAGTGAGFAFPLFDDPLQSFRLLMGDDIDLVTFDSGPLSLAFSYSQSFGPVYAPPPVLITISGSASVTAHIRAGFDTYGIRKAIENEKVDIGILDSLYLATENADGTPLEVLRFTGQIGAGAQVSVLIVTVGIEGGITITVGFSWNDPTPDGKFRFGEFSKAALTNPICLFKVAGKLSLYLKLYVTIGIDPFSVDFDVPLANVTLLDFSVAPDCTPPPPVLASKSGSTLIINTATRATGGGNVRGADYDIGNADDSVDKVVVSTLHDWTKDGHPWIGFVVTAAGDRQIYTDVTRVLVDGHGWKGGLDLTFQGDGDTTKTSTDKEKVPSEPFDEDVVVFGGDGPDLIRAGRGNTYIDGRGGPDQIATTDVRPLGLASGTTTPTHTVVAGGSGDDSIATGGADDSVAGDGSITLSDLATRTTWDWPARGTGGVLDPSTGAGKDTISVGLGRTDVWGGEGDDVISVATDNPLAKKASPDASYTSQGVVVVAGNGQDTVSAGSGDDVIYTGTGTPTAPDGDGTGDVSTDLNTVDTGTGNDTVYGGQGMDHVAGHSTQTQKDLFYGGKGDDILAGGYGKDEIFGGPDDDQVLAEPSALKDGVATLLPLPAGIVPQPKLLVGGDNSDVIYGGNGGASIYGDRKESPCVPPSTDPASDDPSDTQTGTPGPDQVYGGNGVDVVAAGGGNDVVHTYGGDDLACGQADEDQLYLGTGDDTGYGGTDTDIVVGDAGADHVYGNSGRDYLYGGDDVDVVEGNDGNDVASGGAANDLVIGGTRFKGRQDDGPVADLTLGDVLYGDAGDDTIIGDNGDEVVAGQPKAYDLALTADPSPQGANDVIFGGSGKDRAFGGLGSDVILGGNDDDWLEGDNGHDEIYGQGGEDRLVGGGTETVPNLDGTGRPDAGDLIRGGDGADLITGDNAVLTALVGGAGTETPVLSGRYFANRYDVQLLDLGLGDTTTRFGDDDLRGGEGADVIYGQSGNDRVRGDRGDDAVEGDQGYDWVEGDAGDDDLVGGSTTPDTGSLGADTATGQLDTGDALFGGPGDDVALGDNGAILRTGPATRVTTRTGSTGAPYTARRVLPLDVSNKVGGGGTASILNPAPGTLAGADAISGGAGYDLLWGQDGDDAISGGDGADYLEGDGGSDTIRGDLSLVAGSTESTITMPDPPNWPGSASDDDQLDGSTGTITDHGQDDIVGGSARSGYRDADDTIEGDGADDVVLGDDGQLVRTPQLVGGAYRDKQYGDRYPGGVAPVLVGTASRTSGTSGVPTRPCTTVVAAATCEPAGSFGNDRIYGDGGNDGLWGQDGDDTIRGGDGADDIFGELGNDQLFGDAGEDAILGDRGGVVNNYLDAADVAALSVGFPVSTNSPPAETFTGFRLGSYDRRVDLLHDTDGDQWIGASTSASMPKDGITTGGNDRIRGGREADSIHAGFGDDLANGDSGGDQVFGGDGADVLWGGKGCDITSTVDLGAGDCFTADSRGTNDRYIDHVFGGTGGTSAASLAGDLGSDLLDFNPRGSFSSCVSSAWPKTSGTAKKPGPTLDPCAWFEMTDKNDGDITNNQHHQGTDWLYGGWDRDVLQGDVAQNGPNPGDRLLDWTGAYNLYTHCNSAYGGFNDVRLFQPTFQDFLQKLAWASSAGRSASDVTTPKTSAFRELAMVYSSDNNAHGSGSAYPTTPGHFDDPASCSD